MAAFKKRSRRRVVLRMSEVYTRSNQTSMVDTFLNQYLIALRKMSSIRNVWWVSKYASECNVLVFTRLQIYQVTLSFISCIHSCRYFIKNITSQPIFNCSKSRHRKRCEICPTLTIKTPERRQCRRSGF